MSAFEHREMARVQAALRDSDRAPKYRGSPNPMYGHCYVACETLYYRLLPYVGQAKLKWLKHEGETHFYLIGPQGGILDPTVSQFKTKPDYTKSRGCGFLTKKPSKRTKRVLRRIETWET